MRKFLAGAFLLAASATQASAQITTSSAAGNLPLQAGWNLLWDFEGAAPASIGLSGDYQIFCGGTIPNVAAQPAGSTGCFFAVPEQGMTQGTASITFNDLISGISFYWGSIDTYNEVRFYNGAELVQIGGSDFINGSQVPSVADGNQGADDTNKRVYFDFGGQTVTHMELTSTAIAFEIDDLAVMSTVPEPGTYALVAAGLAGLAGFARRRRGA